MRRLGRMVARLGSYREDFLENFKGLAKLMSLQSVISKSEFLQVRQKVIRQVRFQTNP